MGRRSSMRAALAGRPDELALLDAMEAEHMPRMLSWVLEDASAYGIEAMLSSAPPSARALYRSEWQPAYAALDLWHERSAR